MLYKEADSYYADVKMLDTLNGKILQDYMSFLTHGGNTNAPEYKLRMFVNNNRPIALDVVI
jgi:hypothetical protein